MTQASPVPAEGVQTASYHSCQESHAEIRFSGWVKHDQVFHRRQCHRILGVSFALVLMLWLLIIVMILKCVCVCVWQFFS